MLTRQRKAHILDVLRRDGQVVAKALSAELGLSEDTIRRDLRARAAAGQLQRVHGGALPASPAVVDVPGRRAISTAAKAAIGRAAAGLIRNGQVVFVDGGTTTEAMVAALPATLRATVVTHSPAIAVALVDRPGIDVLTIGGRLFRHSVVAVGADAVAAIGRVRADLYVMGVTGVHPEVGLTTGDAEEAAVKRALMAASAETMVLASREKLGAASPFVVAPVAQASWLVTEAGIAEAATAPYAALGLSVVRASPVTGPGP
ncbi:MAG: DeoR/GlpR family DNA-binding transcription regulator [Alphaproteobacteria bacterium]